MRKFSFFTKLDPWIRGTLALGLVAIAVHSGWHTTRQVRAKSRYSSDDIVRYNEKRWGAAQAFLKDKLPAGPVGYLLVADKAAVPEDSKIAQYFSSQFVLLPWRLEADLSNATLRWALADFMGVSLTNWTPPAGWRIAKIYSDGVAVLQRIEATGIPPP
jgi:hypothetical protein